MTFEVVVRSGNANVVTATTATCNVELKPGEGQPFQDGATYTVSVRKRTTNAASSPLTATITIAQLAAPTGLQVISEGHALAAQWQPVAGAADYEAQILDARGNPLDSQGFVFVPQPDVKFDGTTAVADVSALAPGAYNVTLAVMYEGKVGVISDPVAFNIPGGWMQVSTWAPTPMSLPVALSHKGLLWVLAGGFENKVYSSPDGHEWTQATSDAPWGRRMGMCTVVFKGRMWLFGGTDGQNEVYHDVWSSTDGLSWTQETPAAGWSPRHSAAAAVFNSRIWIMGGSERGLNSLQDVWSSADGINWEQAPAPPWGRRFEAYAAVVRNRLYLLGGFDMLGNEQPGTQAHNIVVGCSDVPLTEWSWFEDDTKPGVVVSIWTAGGWKLLDGTTQLSAVVPYRGLYYYRVALRNVAMLQGRAALLSSQKTAANVVFYVPPTQTLPSPIPAGYAPVVADSAGTLIDELFNVHGDEPRLVYGQFSALGSAVTATPDSGIYKILFELGGTASALYTVNSSLVACSDTPLTEWGWYQADQKPAGVTSVWTEHGWQNVSPNKLDDATPFRRLYFYRIDLNNAQVPGQMSALITSREQSATVVFFTRVGSTRA